MKSSVDHRRIIHVKAVCLTILMMIFFLQVFSSAEDNVVERLYDNWDREIEYRMWTVPGTVPGSAGVPPASSVVTDTTVGRDGPARPSSGYDAANRRTGDTATIHNGVAPGSAGVPPASSVVTDKAVGRDGPARPSSDSPIHRFTDLPKNSAYHSWTYTYDTAGNLLTAVDPIGREKVLEYDSLSRLTKETAAIQGEDPDAVLYTDILQTINYAYDLNDNLTQAKEEKWICPAFTQYGAVQVIEEDVTGSGNWNNVVFQTNYLYDGLDRLEAHTEGYWGTTNTFYYDRNGSRTGIRFHGETYTNPSARYAYDANNRLTNVLRTSETKGATSKLQKTTDGKSVVSPAHTFPNRGKVHAPVTQPQQLNHATTQTLPLNRNREPNSHAHSFTDDEGDDPSDPYSPDPDSHSADTTVGRDGSTRPSFSADPAIRRHGDTAKTRNGVAPGSAGVPPASSPGTAGILPASSVVTDSATQRNGDTVTRPQSPTPDPRPLTPAYHSPILPLTASLTKEGRAEPSRPTAASPIHPFTDSPTEKSTDDLATYAYYPDGLLHTINFANGVVTTYEYYNNGWTKSISSYAGADLVSKYEYDYDADGNRTEMREWNATPARRAEDPAWADEDNPAVTTYAYDDLGRLIDVIYPNGRHVHYEYDKVGNRKEEIETNASSQEIKNRSYAYNHLNQVEYIKDNLDNPDPERSIRYEYNAAGDTLAKIFGTLDAATGEIITETSRMEFEWDAWGRLRRVTKTDAGSDSTIMSEFCYDYASRRIHHDSQFVQIGEDSFPTDTRLYIYDQQSCLAEYNITDTLDLAKARQYIYGNELLAMEKLGSGSKSSPDPDSPIHQLTHSPQNPDSPIHRLTHSPQKSDSPTTVFYHQDTLGSTIDLTDTEGIVIKAYIYDAWGNFRELEVQGLANTSPDLDENGFYAWEYYLEEVQAAFADDDNRFTYTGHEFDPSTGLYFYGARFYDPELGRFNSQDPYLGDSLTPPSLHRYMYAYSNPLMYVDLTGYAAERKISIGGLSTILKGWRPYHEYNSGNLCIAYSKEEVEFWQHYLYQLGGKKRAAEYFDFLQKTGIDAVTVIEGDAKDDDMAEALKLFFASKPASERNQDLYFRMKGLFGGFKKGSIVDVTLETVVGKELQALRTEHFTGRVLRHLGFDSIEKILEKDRQFHLRNSSMDEIAHSIMRKKIFELFVKDTAKNVAISTAIFNPDITINEWATAVGWTAAEFSPYILSKLKWVRGFVKNLKLNKADDLTEILPKGKIASNREENRNG